MRRGLVAIATVLACEAEPPPAPEIEALLVGCAALQGDRCVRPSPGVATRCEPSRNPGDDGSFTAVVWVPGRDDVGLVAEGPHPSRAAMVVRTDGTRLELDVPGDAEALALVQGGRAIRRWPIVTPGPEPAAIVHARAALARRDRDPSAAIAELEAASFDDRDRAVALDLAADLGFRVAERTSTWTDALARTRIAHDWARDHADPARARCHARRAMFVAFERLHDADALATWQAALAASTTGEAADAGADGYARGLVAQRLGDLPAAARQFAIAVEGAQRFADRPLEAAASQQLATVLAGLGRDDEVDPLLDRAEDAAAALECRQWLHMLNNVGWARAMAALTGHGRADPVPTLAEALPLLDAARSPDDPCHDDWLAVHVRLGLALVAADRGWLGWAEALRAELPAEVADAPDTASWAVELDRRLARADRGAAIEWMLVHDRDPPPDAPESAWAWAWGRGELAERLGDDARALAEYDAAERSLSALMLQLDSDGGREALLLGRQRSAARRIDLLVAHDRVDEALCVARNARSRSSRVLDRSARISALSPDARARWTAALAHRAELAAELDRLRGEQWSIAVDARREHERAVAAAEAAVAQAGRVAAESIAELAWRDDCTPLRRRADVILAYVPLDDATWMGFAIAAEAMSARTLRLPISDDRRELSRALLEPFASAIDHAHSLEIWPAAWLWDVPFAALPWHDDVLLGSHEVVLGLDLAGPGRGDDARTAVVVSDPLGDLPAAAEEGAAVLTALHRHGWDVHALRGAGATAGSTRAALAEVGLLHYAGHGHRRGREGWQSALELADDGRIEVGDVLALPRVPSLVVMPACETAPSGVRALGGDMSLARAFLLAGTEVVIAAAGPVDDRVAARIGAALYAEGVPTPADAVAHLRAAQLAARDDARLPADVRAQWSRIVAVRR